MPPRTPSLEYFKGKDLLPMARALRAMRPSFQHILVSGEPDADDVIALDRLETTQPSSVDLAGPASCDVALFLLFGGTTGIPKLIPKTHDDYGSTFARARACAASTGDRHSLDGITRARGPRWVVVDARASWWSTLSA